MKTSVSIPVADPKRSYLAHKDEIDSAIARVLAGGQYILGPEVAAFEREFAEYIGVAHAVGVASGTDAIHLALKVCGVGPGDLVATVSHTAVATVAAIELSGATPVFIDVADRTFTMDAGSLENALKTHRDRVKAVVPVHLYGHPAELTPIIAMAEQYRAAVIEDCAQSHGAFYQERRTGAWGHMAAFSFYPTKNLGAIGDGGAVTTHNATLAERAERMRQYGWRERYLSETAGMNSRLDEIQAAILRIKLKYLDDDNAKRIRIASQYAAGLSGAPLTLPVELPHARHVYHQFTVRSNARDNLQAQLAQAGIGTAILYPQPVHLQAAYRDRLKPQAGALETTERLSREILSLPMYPELTDPEVSRIIQSILAIG